LSEQHEQNLHTKSNQQLCSSGDTHGTDNLMIFTARSTYVRRYCYRNVVCLPSVCNVGGSWSHKLGTVGK